MFRLNRSRFRNNKSNLVYAVIEMSITDHLDYDLWVRSWDLQQNAHIKNRELRFQFMFEMVEHVCGKTPIILDMACGPGSLSERFLNKFPEGRSIGVDYDPVLLKIAINNNLYDHNRVEFVEANLTADDWIEKLPVKKFDAILTTTALHWLPEEGLRNLYSKIYSLLDEHGIFLNGDHIYPEAEPPELKDIFTGLRHSFEDAKFTRKEALNWSDWWKELSKYGELKELFEERNRRYPDSDNHSQNISLEKHLKYLHSAGFKTAGVGWQEMDNRVVMALK